jgi:hypothetical protein
MLYDMSNAYLTYTVRDQAGNIVPLDDLPPGAVEAAVCRHLGIPPAGFWKMAMAGRRWGEDDGEDETTVKLSPPRRGRKVNENRSRVRRFFPGLRSSHS